MYAFIVQAKLNLTWKKSEFFSPDQYCAIFIFRTYIFIVQFSDHLPPLNDRINGRLFGVFSLFYYFAREAFRQWMLNAVKPYLWF